MTNTTQDLSKLRERDRKLLEAKYRLFDHFALEDQRSYYQSVIKRNRKASNQVNLMRASFALLTIVVTGIATYLVQTNFASGAETLCLLNTPGQSANCLTAQGAVNVLLLLSILFPALGAFCNMLADLYQWDRLVQIYDEAVKGLEVPDALSPDTAMSDEEFRASLMAYVSGTLKVMREETGQWGQLIRTSEDLERFQEQAVSYYKSLEESKLGPDAPGTRTPAADAAAPTNAAPPEG